MDISHPSRSSPWPGQGSDPSYSLLYESGFHHSHTLARLQLAYSTHDPCRIHIHLMGQLINSGFHCINSLCGTISTICTGCLHVGVNNLIVKSIGFQIPVQGNCLMTCKSDGCRTVISVCTSIGKRLYFNSFYDSVLICTNFTCTSIS